MMKIKYFKVPTTLLLCAIAMNQLYSQSGTKDMNNRVEVMIDKEPVIQSSEKKDYSPIIKEQEVKKEKYDLESPDKLILVEYSPNQLKAQAAKKDLLEKHQHSYIKIGFGSLLQPYAELNYNDIVKEKFTYGLKYTYTMAQGKLSNQKMNYHKGGLYADYAASKQLKMGLNLDYNREVHHYYGYNLNNDAFDDAPSSIRQIVNHFAGKVYFLNPKKNRLKLDYRQDVGFNYMFTKSGNTEYSINGNTNIAKQFKQKHFANLLFNFDINKLTYPSIKDSINRNIFRFAADYTFDDDNWSLKAGFQLAFDGKTTYLFPNLVTEKRLYKHILIFYSAWNRELQKNSYLSLVTKNPFINDRVEIRNTRVENRVAGFKGSIQNFDYDIRFTNKVAKNFALYVNDTSDMKRFDVVYDRSTQIINLQLEASYNINQKLKFDLIAGYTVYEALDFIKAWHMPAFTGNFRCSYLWKEKLYTYIDINGIAGAYARDKNMNAVAIKGAADINIGANYQFHKNFSVFLDAKNLAHMKYQNWYLYPQFGANVMLGVKFSY